MTTVQDMVSDIQREMLRGDLMPVRASELLVEATALIANCSAEIREAEGAFNTKYLAILHTEAKANRAKIFAEATDEWKRLRKARDTEKFLDKVIGSIKYVLRTAENEMRAMGGQR